jgi:hypothetical protein
VPALPLAVLAELRLTVLLGFLAVPFPRLPVFLALALVGM